MLIAKMPDGGQCFSALSVDKAHQNHLECFKKSQVCGTSPPNPLSWNLWKEVESVFSKHLRLFLSRAKLSTSRDKGARVGYRYMDLTHIKEEGM